MYIYICINIYTYLYNQKYQLFLIKIVIRKYIYAVRLIQSLIIGVN